jgi:aryl-alcohol dehydrogenase-like predicted oxidoreductase
MPVRRKTGSNIMTDARPQKRILGDTDLSVSPVGLGCMGMSEFYGPAMDEREAVALLQEAVERGVSHFDTAEMYGIGHNERLVGRALRDRRDGLVIATKFGPLRDPKTGERLGVDGSPANVRRASRGSLERLGLETIDLYYLHRMDPDTPIEDTVGEMKKLVEEGRVRALGLSEASAETIRRAHAVHPITALQTEYSLFSRHVEKEILPTCRELGISLVAYSPLGRGLLGGDFTRENRPAGEGEFRRGEAQPRFRDGKDGCPASGRVSGPSGPGVGPPAGRGDCHDSRHHEPCASGVQSGCPRGGARGGGPEAAGVVEQQGKGGSLQRGGDAGRAGVGPDIPSSQRRDRIAEITSLAPGW